MFLYNCVGKFDTNETKQFLNNGGSRLKINNHKHALQNKSINIANYKHALQNKDKYS